MKLRGDEVVVGRRGRMRGRRRRRRRGRFGDINSSPTRWPMEDAGSWQITVRQRG